MRTFQASNSTHIFEVRIFAVGVSSVMSPVTWILGQFTQFWSMLRTSFYVVGLLAPRTTILLSHPGFLTAIAKYTLSVYASRFCYQCTNLGFPTIVCFRFCYQCLSLDFAFSCNVIFIGFISLYILFLIHFKILNTDKAVFERQTSYGPSQKIMCVI